LERLRGADAAARLAACQEIVTRVRGAIRPEVREAELGALSTVAEWDHEKSLDAGKRWTVERFGKSLDGTIDDYGSSGGVLVLADAIADADDRVRGEALAALGLFGPRAKPAVPALLRQLSATTGTGRTAVAEALWWVDRNPAVAEALAAEVRSGAAERLAALVTLRRMSGQPHRGDSKLLEIQNYLHSFLEGRSKKDKLRTAYRRRGSQTRR
jgi:hypothetical protein